MSLVRASILVGIVLGGAAVGGCTIDPAAPLIPLPQRQATILPSEANPRGPDGFPNILADPATVPGLPRTPAETAAEEAALAAEGRATAAAAGAVRTTSSAAALAARGRNHVAETRAAIEASGRPDTGAPTNTLSAPAPAPAQPVDPGRPIDPDEPWPRAVGVPPFTGEGVAPER